MPTDADESLDPPSPRSGNPQHQPVSHLHQNYPQKQNHQDQQLQIIPHCLDQLIHCVFSILLSAQFGFCLQSINHNNHTGTTILLFFALPGGIPTPFNWTVANITLVLFGVVHQLYQKTVLQQHEQKQHSAAAPVWIHGWLFLLLLPDLIVLLSMGCLVVSTFANINNESWMPQVAIFAAWAWLVVGTALLAGFVVVGWHRHERRNKRQQLGPTGNPQPPQPLVESGPHHPTHDDDPAVEPLMLIV